MIATLDRAIYRAERAAVAAMLALMGVVVFLDVAYRVSTRTGSWLANPLAVGVVGAGLGIAALRTRDVPGAPWKGALLGVGVAVAQQVFVVVLPNGLVWSQTLALALTLWLGLMGASLAAYERRHLALDVGSRLWPPAVAPKVAAVGHAVTAAFCVGLVGLAGRSLFGYDLGGAHVPGHYDTWADSDGAAGNMMALALPKWVVFASVPYGMTMLAFRFSTQAARVWLGLEALGGDDTLQQLGIQESRG